MSWGSSPVHYRPLVALSFGLNERLTGLAPLGYAWVNIGLALGTAGAIILLVRALRFPTLGGVFGAVGPELPYDADGAAVDQWTHVAAGHALRGGRGCGVREAARRRRSVFDAVRAPQQGRAGDAAGHFRDLRMDRRP